MMRPLCALAAASLLAGCVSMPSTPSKRPVTAESMQAIGKTKVALAENMNGVEKSWFMTDSSAATAQYGLIGALVGGVMDAIINAGPSRRAQKAADEIAELLPADELNASMLLHLQTQTPGSAVSIGDVSTVQKILTPDAQNDVVEVNTTYTLSEDASAFRMIARVSYRSSTLKYATPYTFKGAAPKSELTGPVYQNTFTYHSAQLPIPPLMPDLKRRLVASIQASYQTETGTPPAANSDDGKALAKELAAARDDKFTKDEIAIFLTRSWLENGGALLKKEVEAAHAFVAQYLVRDLNSTEVPSFTGSDVLLNTASDGRTVRLVGANVDAGAYVSAPGTLTSFTTYGNAISVAKVHSDKIRKLSEQARAAKAVNGKKKKTA